MDKNLEKIRKSFAVKLGEVLAFARVGADTFERGSESLDEVWGNSKVSDVVDANNDHAERIEAIAEELEFGDMTLEKADATERKLKQMRSTYLKGEWDEAHEVLEWLGFFEGGAIVHWDLIKGFLESQSDADLSGLSDEALQFHQQLLQKVSSSIKEA